MLVTALQHNKSVASIIFNHIATSDNSHHNIIYKFQGVENVVVDDELEK